MLFLFFFELSNDIFGPSKTDGASSVLFFKEPIGTIVFGVYEEGFGGFTGRGNKSVYPIFLSIILKSLSSFSFINLLKAVIFFFFGSGGIYTG